MSMKILIVRSNPIDPDPRVEKTARVLTEAGYQVFILGWDRTTRLPEIEDRPYARIYRYPLQAGFARGILNLPNLLRWELAQFRWLILRRLDYDIIHACDFDTILPALIVSKVWGKKIVYDVFDFYADMLRATPTLLKAFSRRLDLWAMRRVDALILADESRQDQIAGVQAKRLAIIYNTPEDCLDHLSQRMTFEPRKDSLHITYVGLLQIERGLMELLEVLEKHPDWKLDLAGFGGDESKIINKAEDLPNVRFHGRVPYHKAIELSYQADVLFATYDPRIPNHRYASPNKIFEAMMLGKPIVVAKGTNMDRIVQAEGFGIVIPYGDVLKLDQALVELASKTALRQKLGEAGREAYEQRYGWDKMRQVLEDLYASL
jgi:glycosyltransferase involved in cell wall biosynthesis